MNILEQVKSAIRTAERNKQNCPICGAPISPEPTGFDSDGSIYYTHYCECLMEVIIASLKPFLDNFGEDIPYEAITTNKQTLEQYNLSDRYLYRLKKEYVKRCHYCGRLDGVNSNLKDCKEDRPYKFRCIHCGHSLRTHHLFGEGRVKDLGKVS